MRTLALDTSTSQGAVAVLEDERVLSRALWTREKSHSEFVTPTIEKCLEDSGIEASQLDAVAVGRGPGSFTGIRIGVNAARTLAYALKLPVYVFDTSEILAAGVPRTDLPVVTIINAHKNLLYTSTFAFDSASRIWKRGLELNALSPEDIAMKIQTPHLCVGDGFEEYEEIFSPELRKNLVRDSSASDYPLPEALGRLAWRTRLDRPPLDWNQIQALYIRASGAEETLREGLGK